MTRINVPHNWRNQATYYASGGDQGKIVSFTTIYRPTEQMDRYKPYSIAIIETTQGGRLTSQVVDCPGDKLSIGMQVEPVLRKVNTDGDDGLIAYGTKWRPSNIA